MMRLMMRRLLPFLIASLVVPLGCTKRADTPPPPAIPARPTIALLREPVSDVKTRPASELVWSPAPDRSPLGDYDAVRTGGGSSARINFNDDSWLTMDELTMIIVVDKTRRQDVEESVVALPNGSLSGRISKTAARPVDLVVRTRRGWIRASRQRATASGGEIRFHAQVSDRGRLRVHSEKGEVQLVASGKERVVHQNETVVVAEPKDAPPAADQARPDEFRELPQVPDTEWQAAKEEPKKEAPRALKTSSVPPDLFRVLQPKGRATITTETVHVEGLLGSALKVYLRGRPVVAKSDGGFALDLPVELGINVLTFQIVGPAGVRYETIEVVRK